MIKGQVKTHSDQVKNMLKHYANGGGGHCEE